MSTLALEENSSQDCSFKYLEIPFGNSLVGVGVVNHGSWLVLMKIKSKVLQNHDGRCVSSLAEKLTT